MVTGRFSLWSVIDRILYRRLGIRPLKENGRSIVGIRECRYRGAPVKVSDGVTVVPGDRILEIHLENQWLRRNGLSYSASVREIAWKVSAAFTDDLRYLAEGMGKGWYPSITALYVKTLLAPPLKRLGFTLIEDGKGLGNRFDRLYLGRLRREYYYGKAQKAGKYRTNRALVHAWISRDTFLDRLADRPT